jgi:membrane protease YdiL (CAAX protease family)
VARFVGSDLCLVLDRTRIRAARANPDRAACGLQERIIPIDRSTSGLGRSGLALQLLVVIGLAAAVIPAMTPAQVVGGGVFAKLLFLARMGLLLLVAARFLHVRGLGWADVGLRRPRPGRMVGSVVGGLVGSMVLVAVLRQVLQHLGGAAADYSMFERLKGNLPEYLYWALPVTVGSAAFGEELLFRGFVRDAIQRLLPSHGAVAAVTAIALQALLFGLLHAYQGWGGVATAGTIGLVLGAVWRASGCNLWAAIVTHGLLDLTSLTVIFLSGVPAAT